MLKISRESKNGKTVISLSGLIEESTDFSKSIGGVSGELEVNCKDVRAINSIGVKKWIEYFSHLVSKGIKVQFTMVSPPLVEQLNAISNFDGGGEVVSALAEYRCASCKASFFGTFKTNDLKRVGFKMPPVKCPKCSAMANFDDVIDEYFSFLIRSKGP